MPFLLGEDISKTKNGKKIYEIKHINSVDPANITLDRSKAKRPFWKLMQVKHQLALKAVENVDQENKATGGRPRKWPQDEIKRAYQEVTNSPKNAKSTKTEIYEAIQEKLAYTIPETGQTESPSTKTIKRAINPK